MTLVGTHLEDEREERLSALGEMCAAIAHEIRNPLGSMDLYCSLLQRDLREQPQLLDLAQQVQAGIKAIERIVSNCLQFTKETKPQREIVPDVAAFLGGTVRLSTAKLTAGEAEIRLVCEGDEIPHVDSFQIQQVILNLIANAVDAMSDLPARERRVELKSSFPRSNVWRLVVTDQGRGIPEEVRDRIFHPFFTTKTRGTGLGLAIVYSIIHAHEGSIVVQSKEASGTRIIVDLPWRGCVGI